MRTPNDKKVVIATIHKLLEMILSPTSSEERTCAIDSAMTLVDEYVATINVVLTQYTDFENQPISSVNRACNYELYRLFQSKPSSRFTKFFNAHEATWQSLAPLLEKITNDYHLDDPAYDNHSLALLLRPNHEAFLESVLKGTLGLGEEIGILAIERMKSMFTSSAATKSQKISISRAIKCAITHPQIKEGIFNFDYTALVFEVTKLYLHIFLQRKKIVWLGTAKTVSAFEKKMPSSTGICLGCPENEYSWGLNRAWLHCATALGYQFQPIEQHFPFVEEAIIRGDCIALISQLAREIRGIDHRSQYTRGDSPTATPQEILFLLSLGFRGHKKEDGVILLVRDEYVGEKLSYTKRRSHSAPEFGSKKPPTTVFSTLDEILKTPSDGSSAEYRNSPISPKELEMSQSIDPLQTPERPTTRAFEFTPPPPLVLLSPSPK